MAEYPAALLRQIVSPLLRRFRKNQSNVRNEYFASAPSKQNALDIFHGEWYTTLPREAGEFRAGAIDLYADPRIAWALGEIGDLNGRDIIELGPLEGAHTYMLEQAGCRSIRSIEGNPRAYLKCLVMKEVVGLQHTHFLCGDFVEYLRSGPERADALIASGVLYHMTNPAELLYLISRVTDCVFLWTHYYDAPALERHPSIKRKLTKQTEAEFAGFRHTLHRYEYWSSFGLKRFIGGPNPHAFWMERDAVLGCLRFFGFDSITTGFDEPEHPDGPAFAVIARRS
ncbi:MAG TPA: hypothetical protein VH302_08995 [Bryobacteraceae bacterium]|nr:hypothetical protein [Bryobacteraceae bacterium]